MNVTQADDKNVSDAEDTLVEYGARQVRAVEEYLTVMPDAVEGDGIVKVVSQSGEEYLVDAVEERCNCPDFEHRGGDENGRCKHIYRSRWATGRDALPVDLVEAVEIEPNFGVFVDKSQIRYATPDGGIVEVEEDVEVLDEDENDECEECAELDGMPCFECYMAERGHDV